MGYHHPGFVGSSIETFTWKTLIRAIRKVAQRRGMEPRVRSLFPKTLNYDFVSLLLLELILKAKGELLGLSLSTLQIMIEFKISNKVYAWSSLF